MISQYGTYDSRVMLQLNIYIVYVINRVGFNTISMACKDKFALLNYEVCVSMSMSRFQTFSWEKIVCLKLETFHYVIKDLDNNIVKKYPSSYHSSFHLLGFYCKF